MKGCEHVNLTQIQRLETHTHSYYSNIRLLDSINRPKDMILTAYQLGLAGIVLTDHECLCGAVDWLNLEKELKEKEQIPSEFKCGLGNEIYLIDQRDKKQPYYHFILIAKDTIGFHQLCKLSSQSWYNSYYDRGMERVPTLKSELQQIITENPGHIIATNACLGGQLAQEILALTAAERKNNLLEIEQHRNNIDDFIAYCLNLFHDDFYIEIAPGTSNDQKIVNKRIKNIAKAYNIKMIYGTDAHYLTKNYRMIHKAYLNSKEGEREIDSFYEFAHLMDNNEAYEYLKEFYTENDFIQFCNNSMEIFNKIDKYDIFHNPIIPRVEVKNYHPCDKIEVNDYPTLHSLFLSDNEQERYWINECWIGLNKMEKQNNPIYLSRLETEADIIRTIGQKLNNCLFEYFNAFQHFIDLFWDCGSIVGPGRGSSVCFLSNKLLGITQLDPIEWNLAEFRFLNKERIELPDVDIDLAPSKRPLILKKIREERGETRVLQVATFGTEGTKSAILTACRGYRSEEYPDGIDNDQALYLASLIPQERGFLWSLDDVTKGNEEKDRQPIAAFNEEMEKYPGLLEIIYGIDGLVNKRSQHASGVILYNVDPWETTALMRSPNGDLTTQFSLHTEEQLGGTKFDFLVTEICDKMANAINLLKQDGYFKDCINLRAIYNKYLHPDKINIKDDSLWDTLASGKVVDLFQFDSPVGGAAIRSILPRNPLQLMMANALTRLTGEKGEERPIEKYVRFKNNIKEWYNECYKWHLTEEDIKILEPYYLPVEGVPTTQEKLMLLCMEPQLAHFTLAEANAARKVCSKKQLNKIPELKEKFISQCSKRTLGEYVWWSAIEPQLSYAFAEPHALAYSFIAIQILVLTTYYPIIYWNCACLITNSGGDEFQQDDAEIIIEDDDEDDEVNEDNKKKIKTTDYGKVATAIGNFKTYGIEVSPPNINKSSFTFTPIVEENRILYGLRGITRVPVTVIKEAIARRPFDSLNDFLEKVKVNKTVAVNLIKSGAFDEVENKPREEIMHNYLESIADQKQRLTLQNMNMLIEKNLIPESMLYYKKLFLFNKFLKTQKNGDYYILNDAALNFLETNFSLNNVEDGIKIWQKTWDNMYSKGMEPMRQYLKDNKVEMLTKLNNVLLQEVIDKYALGNISKWEMDSISFYAHAHELIDFKNDFDDFNQLSEEPQIEYSFAGNSGQEIKVFKIYNIIGTVIDKDKIRNTVTLLTPTGVVNVKVYKNQYALYDKQISQRDENGVKHVIEASWFKRGTLLRIQGIRRGADFIPRKSKKNPFPVIAKIISITNGLQYQYERLESDEV